MRVVSLFSGVGGFDLGLERAGHELVYQCEADPYRRQVLARHWPGLPLAEDVRSARAPVADVVCGGFPCQDLSVAGHRAGLEGERSSLFYECARIADESLAAGGWLIIENVPGLLSANERRDFAIVLRTLADLGFHDLAWRVLDSRFFGVPQRRRRVYIVARRAQGDRSRAVLLDEQGSSGHREAGGQAGQGNTGTVRRGPAAAGGVTCWPDPAGPVTKRQGKGVNTTMDDGAMIRDALGVRRLTPTECERLQGFPDGWTLLDGPSLATAPSWYEPGAPSAAVEEPAPDGRRYQACGDAVTVPVAHWLGLRLARFGNP